MSNKYNITCVFEDGATSHFQSSAIETVYSAALRSGLTLETDCREGCLRRVQGAPFRRPV